MDNSQNILRLASAAAILLVGVSVAYHYIIYIPTKDTAARNYLLAKEDLAKEAAADYERREEAARKAKATAAQLRRTSYQICVSNAQADYSGRWAASCKRRAAESDRERQSCLARGVAGATCLQWHPVRTSENCGLPTALANDYDKSLSDDKDRCFRESSIEAATIE